MHTYKKTAHLLKRSDKIFQILFLATLLVLTMTMPATAQRFKKGYVVSDQGDTTRYAIDLSGAVSGATSVTVRSGGITRQLSAKSVRAFGFEDGAVFESSTFFPMAQDLGSALEQELLVNHVFYQQMVKGVISLYKYEGKYIAMTQEKLVELRYLYELKELQQAVYVGGQRRTNTQNYTNKIYEFRDVLKELFSDCPEVVAMADKTELTDASLKKIFIAFNTCKGVEFQVSRKSGGLQVSASAGISYFSAAPGFDNNISSNASAVYQVDYRNQSGISPHLDLYLTLPKVVPNLYFRLGLNFLQWDAQERIVEVSSSVTSTEEVNLQLNYTTINMGLQYELERGSYATLGSGLVYFSNSFVEVERTAVSNISNPPTSTTQVTSPLEIASNVPVFYAGMGQRFSLGKKLDLFAELRYTRIGSFHQRSFFNRQAVSSRINTVQVLLGLRL